MLKTRAGQIVGNVPNHPAFFRLPEVLRRTGLKRSTLYWLIGQGDFPPPVLLGKRIVGWVESEIDEWIASRIARRDLRDSKPVAATALDIATGGEP